jgi:hypothetical protein
MHDPEALARVGEAALEIIGELKVRRLFPFALVSDAEQILRFLDDEDLVVFEANEDSGGQLRLGDLGAVGANGDDVAAAQGVIELGDGPSVDHHRLELEPGAHLLLLHLRPGGEQKREKLCGLRDGGRLRHGFNLSRGEVADHPARRGRG